MGVSAAGEPPLPHPAGPHRRFAVFAQQMETAGNAKALEFQDSSTLQPKALELRDFLGPQGRGVGEGPCFSGLSEEGRKFLLEFSNPLPKRSMKVNCCPLTLRPLSVLEHSPT